MNFHLLKNKDYLLLLLGDLVSLVGSRMQSFALSLYVLNTTGSAAKFASILSITFIPELILGPIAGVFADWFDRKKLIVTLDILSGTLVGIYALIYLIDKSFINIFSITILVALLSIISTIFQPAIATITPGIVKKEQLVDANGLSTIVSAGGRLAAPIIAGIFLQKFGLFWIFLINSLSFLCSAASETFINIPKNNRKHEKITFKSFFADFSEGIKFIYNNKLILGIGILLLSVNFFIAPVIIVGEPYILKTILKISDTQYGFFQSGLMIPMFAAPVLCSLVSKKVSLNKIIYGSMIINSLIVAVIGIATTNTYLSMFKSNLIPFIIIFMLFFIISIFDLVSNLAICSMEQEIVPLSLLGRVESVLTSIAFALTPLGQMIFGFLLDKFNACVCIIAVSILTLISVILTKSLFLNINKANIDINSNQS